MKTNFPELNITYVRWEKSMFIRYKDFDYLSKNKNMHDTKMQSGKKDFKNLALFT